MVCSNCGTPYVPDARFCGSCGQPTRTHADERRVVTVVFADLVGFTSLSENLDPERVKHLVDMAFERLVHDVHEFGGRVDKILGDAILALFGAPVAHEDDAERAVRAALRMQETLAAFAAESSIDIRMRVGVNTGEVLVGALRAGGDYTAMGDVVNTASRLQTTADPGEVLVGAWTHRATAGVFAYESRGSLIVRGREGPVDVWVATEALVPPGHRARRITPLVGRDTELAVLENLVRLTIENGRGQLIVLLGEAGVGKTRIANEIAPMVRGIDSTAAVFNGRCLPYGEANPWWPIGEPLRVSCGIDADDPLDVARSKCAHAVAYVLGSDPSAPDIVSGLLHLMGYEGPLRALEPVSARGQAAEALLAFMEAGVRIRPLVVRLADLHWADEQVLELLDNLSEHLARLPFVLVATARRALLSRWAPKAGRYNSLVLNLDPLSRGASAELLEALVGDGIEEELRATLLDRSGGNPFYLEELATLVLNRQSGAAHAVGEEVPDTLRGLIAARIDGLTAAEQLSLEDAAVWGTSGPLLALREISRAVRGDADVDDTVESLALKDVLVVEGDAWSFRSDLVREIAYVRLTKAERLRRHHGIATYLEMVSGGRFIDDGYVDTVAHHFFEAARLSRELETPAEAVAVEGRAIAWSGEAARRADGSASWPLSERLYTQGVELTIDPVWMRERLTFLLGRAHARTEMWRFDEARADTSVASALLDGGDDLAGEARLDLLIGEIDSREGHYELALDRLDSALERFDALGDLHGRAEALRQKGMAALFRSDTASAEDPIRQSLDAFRAVADRRGEAWALQNLAWIAFITGRIDVAEERLGDAFTAFEEIDDRSGLAWTEGLLAFVRFYQGQFAEARQIGERILRESERRNDRWAQAMMLTMLGAIDLWQGSTIEALEAGHRAVGLFDGLGDAMGLEQSLSLVGRASAMVGRAAEGLAAVDRASSISAGGAMDGQRAFTTTASVASRAQLGVDQAVDSDEALAAVAQLPQDARPADLLAALGLARAQAGLLDGAEQTARQSVAGDRGSADAYGRAVLALTLAALGRHDEVADLLDGAEVAGTYVDRCYGLIARGLGRPADWSGLFESALELVGDTEDVLTAATVELALAMVAESMGHARADAWRERAEHLWVECGVDPVGWRRLFAAACATTPADR